MGKEIIIYTTSTCPYCNMLKEFFKQNNVTFKEVNVEDKPEKMQEIVTITGQMGVPQTQIDDQWIVGFDPEKIISTLAA